MQINISDFYDKNSMTCTSQLFDPSVESDFVERNLQHHVAWRNLSSEKGVVRLTSGLFLILNMLIEIPNPGSYAACGFEVLLKRKHEPLVYI